MGHVQCLESATVVLPSVLLLLHDEIINAVIEWILIKCQILPVQDDPIYKTTLHSENTCLVYTDQETEAQRSSLKFISSINTDCESCVYQGIETPRGRTRTHG